MSRQEQCGLECSGVLFRIYCDLRAARLSHMLDHTMPSLYTLPQLLLCFSLSHARARKGQRGHETLTDRKA